MNLKELLTTDHEAIAQWLMHAFRWWIDELMAIVPPEWRERFLQRSSNTAEVTGETIAFRDERTREPLKDKPRGSIKILLSADSVLMREVDLPILPASDVKRMISLDIDRLTPFRSDRVLFDTDVLSRNEETGRQKVMLGVIPRASAARLVQQIRAENLEPIAIGVMSGSAGNRPNFDFLPPLREVEGGSAARKRATYWWAAAAALLLFNLFLFNYRESSALDQLRETVESQQAPVSVAMRLRDKVEHEAARRSGLLKEQARSSPLGILDAVTEALPNDAWVERFEWNGRTVHIRGFRRTTPNLLERIEASPLLRNAHSLTSNAAAATGEDTPFDLAADKQTGASR